MQMKMLPSIAFLNTRAKMLPGIASGAAWVLALKLQSRAGNFSVGYLLGVSQAALIECARLHFERRGDRRGSFGAAGGGCGGAAGAVAISPDQRVRVKGSGDGSPGLRISGCVSQRNQRG